MLGLQLKRARERPTPNIYEFEFNNNRWRDQHNLVWLTSARTGTPPAIYYSLTCVSDISELERVSPDLRPNTLLLDPFPIGPINDQRPHEFLVDRIARTYTVFSEEPLSTGKLRTWKEVLADIKSKHAGAEVADLKERLKRESNFERDRELFINAKVGKRRVNLRGILIPPQQSM